VTDLAANPAALNIGRNLFLNNCATCHGSDGGGAPGFPNLSDNDWLWGGEPDTVRLTIADGRTGIMPPWGEALGARGVEDVLAYVLSLQGRKLEAGNSRAGKEKFQQLCAACHGVDARGNPLLGAPNLTDGIWLHGGSLAAIRDTIEKGRNGAMPAHGIRLGETRVKLLAAYVLSLGRQPETTVAANPADASVH
jgi:cytochrome c oxidase cbb3-type subunit 3